MAQNCPAVREYSAVFFLKITCRYKLASSVNREVIMTDLYTSGENIAKGIYEKGANEI